MVCELCLDFKNYLRYFNSYHGFFIKVRGRGVRERVTINDMPHSEGIISFRRTIDCYLIFIKSCKASAMPAAKACWSHLACQINWNKNRHITFYQ